MKRMIAASGEGKPIITLDHKTTTLPKKPREVESELFGRSGVNILDVDGHGEIVEKIVNSTEIGGIGEQEGGPVRKIVP